MCMLFTSKLIILWLINHLYILLTVEGHYMASRLSRSITTQSRKLRLLLTEYNATVSSVEQLSWEDVTNLTSSLWLTSHENDFLVPRSVRITAINILMKSKRAVEELQLLKAEMHNVLKFHIEQHTALVDTILQLQAAPSEFNCGAVCLLKIRKSHCERELKACIKSFSHLISIPEISFSLEEVHYNELEFDTPEDDVYLPENNINLNDNFTGDVDSNGVANVGGMNLSNDNDDNNDSFVDNIDLDDYIDTDVNDDVDTDVDVADIDDDIDVDIDDDNLNGKLDDNLDDHDDNDDNDYDYDTEISKL